MFFFSDFGSDFYKNKSLLTAKNLVNWKKKNGFYNFNKLPKTAIISPINSFNKINVFLKPKIRGLLGKIHISNGILYATNFGIGAPATIALLAELYSLGVTQFVFIGIAGRLNNSIKESELFAVNNAFSLNGSSYFYYPETNIRYETEFSKKIIKMLDISNKTTLSVDIPFRETESLINKFKLKKAELIDMETASLLAFSKYNKINFCALLITSDSIDEEWKPPKNVAKIYSKLDKTVKKLISLL
jgi:uridine phosphorylase